MLFDVYINPKEYLSEPNFCNEAIKLFNSATIGIYGSGLEVNHNNIKPTVKWCRKHFKYITGNALINFPYTPTSFRNININKIELVIKNKIQETISLYPEITKWILFNELVEHSGQLRTNTYYWDKTKSIHPITFISNYIEKCFNWAIEANPNAVYLINDYHPHNRLKWNTILDIADRLKSKSIPVEIGIQHHTHTANKRLISGFLNGFNLWRETTDIVTRLKQRQIPITFTETSIWNSTIPFNIELQELLYIQLAEIAINNNISFNIWCLTDKKEYHWSFKPNDTGAGILDSNYLPKPIYWKLKYIIDKVNN